MVVKRAAIFTHDPTPAILTGQWRRRTDVYVCASLIQGIDRSLMWDDEHIAARVGFASPTNLLAEHGCLAGPVDDIRHAHVTQVIQHAALRLAGIVVGRSSQLIAAVAQPTALVADIIILAG